MNKKKSQDGYAFGMDWGGNGISIGALTNYRQYQFDRVAGHLGKNILEVGSGASRSFTKLIVQNHKHFCRLLSIEPSSVLLEKFEKLGGYKFPDNVEFQNTDLFDIKVSKNNSFDTVLFIHVLEHIKDDRKALNHTHQLLQDGGKILIEVPALPMLFSVHDEMLGHYRRYDKKMLLRAVDTKKYIIKDIWYNDPIGALGSFYFFKLRKIKLKSERGVNIFKKQGQFYDKFLVPLQKKIESYFRAPFGLSLNAILQKK